MNGSRGSLIIGVMGELAEIPAGNRELDAKLALICGWKRRTSGSDGGAGRFHSDFNGNAELLEFSSSIEDAGKLLGSVTKAQYAISYVAGDQLASCTLNQQEFWTARTVPTAICAAALSLYLGDDDKSRCGNLIRTGQ